MENQTIRKQSDYFLLLIILNLLILTGLAIWIIGGMQRTESEPIASTIEQQKLKPYVQEINKNQKDFSLKTPTPTIRLIVSGPPPTNTATPTPTLCDPGFCQSQGFDTFQDVFLITCYNVPLETDFTQSKVTKVVVTNPNTCATTTEDFRSDFLAAVNLNGTGKDDDGQLISIEWFCSGANYRYVSCPTGSCGVCLTAGDSFALSSNRFVCAQPVCI